MWRDTYQHMDMIRTSLGFMYLDFFLIAQGSQYSPNVTPDFTVNNLTTKFWGKYQMILAFPPCV